MIWSGMIWSSVTLAREEMQTLIKYEKEARRLVRVKVALIVIVETDRKQSMVDDLKHAAERATAKAGDGGDIVAYESGWRCLWKCQVAWRRALSTVLRLVEALGRAASFDGWGWPIVIHCNSGVHRAPSLALAILVRLKGLPEASRSRLRGRSAVGSIDLHSVWQVRHLATSTFTLCGRCGTWHWAGSGGALGSRLSPRLFVWQAWQSEASTSILCGRCGTWRHQPSLCVAGVALARIHLHSVWQALHLATSTFTLCARRGIYGTVALCVSGVAIGSIQLDSVGEAWHLATSTFPVSGRCGMCGTGLALVARLVPVCRRLSPRLSVWPFGSIHLHSVWQACGDGWIYLKFI